MIRVDRGPAPPELALIRATELRRIRAQKRAGATVDVSHEYNHPHVRSALHEAQKATCCYCESFIQKKGTPIEHFRPKQRAIRGAGRPEHGYWWLTWSWENLFLACTACNHTKGDKFPLSNRGGLLRQGSAPPGPERSLFIDPAASDPMKKIRFTYVRGRWRPIPRKPGSIAKTTIREIGLDAPDFLDNYHKYVNGFITPHTRDVKRKIKKGAAVAVRRAWARLTGTLFGSWAPYKALSYDVLDHRFPPALRATWKLLLPKP